MFGIKLHLPWWKIEDCIQTADYIQDFTIVNCFFSYLMKQLRCLLNFLAYFHNFGKHIVEANVKWKNWDGSPFCLHLHSLSISVVF